MSARRGPLQDGISRLFDNAIQCCVERREELFAGRRALVPVIGVVDIRCRGRSGETGFNTAVRFGSDLIQGIRPATRLEIVEAASSRPAGWGERKRIRNRSEASHSYRGGAVRRVSRAMSRSRLLMSEV